MAFDAAAFAALPEEIRLRLLMRAVNRFGHEGPAELGKLETLLAELDRNFTEGPRRTGPKPAGVDLKQTLAGALVSLKTGQIRIEPAPARRKPAR
jgi:tRNA(Ile)-lysidine synthase